MKKRIFSCFMALALCLTLLPATAQAEDGHSPHPICGKTCSHTGPGEKQHQNDAFKNAKWMASYTGKLSVGSPEGSIYGDGLTEKDNYVILTTGYYYLSYTADGCDHSYVRSLKTIKIQGDVTICLNGKQIQNIGDTTGPVFEVPTGSTLTLTDCTGNGQIIRDSSFSNGSGVYVNGGTLNLYSGQITKSTGQQGTVSNKNNYGGGVYVNNGGTFNMYGGFITGNSANYGGGVYVKSGTFNMYGGTIKENTSSEGYGSGFGGAGVYVEASGNFIMNNDASVTGNKATGYGATLNGGGVFVNGGTFTMNNNASVTGNKAKNGTLNGGGVYVSGNGTFTMNNNASVTGNKTANNNATLNGGVYVNGGTFNMNDGAIRGNAATNNGGGVYVNRGTFNMNDGAISGNEATNNKPTNTTYGGVYVNGGTFTMNGNASIKSNTAKNGGGVYASAGTFNMNGNASIKSNTGNGVCVSDTARFTVSDTPTVTENTMNGNDSNVYLNGGAYITIGDYGLHGSAGSIGVTKTINPKAEKTVIATGKNALLAEDAAKFKSDKDGYAVSVDTDDTKQLVLKMVETPTPEHTHKWEYELSGDNKTITATCTGEGVCAVSNNGGSVTIKASTTTHDGNPKPATLEKSTKWQSVYSKDITITYEQKKGDAYKKIDGVPTEVGKYKASITVGGKTAFVEYEITGGTPEIVPVSQITLNKAETSISVGNSETLTATVTPENAANKDLKWASSDTSVATVAADGTVTAVKAGTATITATAADGSGKSATCTVTVTGGTTPSQPGGSTGGSSSGGGGGSSSDRDSSDSNPVIKTETKNNADGSTTKTETRKDGTVTQTTTAKDGSTSKTETKKDGSSVTENKAADGSTGTVKTDKHGQTEAKTALSNKAIEDAKKNGEAVKVPVEVEASRNSSTAPTVKVELPKGTGETKVEIPVSNVKPGTVAVLVHPDGTEEILKNSIPTEDGIQLTVDGSATVKIIDNSKGFIDTQDHWAKDAIDFVSARGLVNGMTDTIYAPNNSTTRAQLWTILARQNDADLSGGSIWYEKAQNWAKDKGVSDGANPNAAINRAQMVTMLWRAEGQPTAGSTANFTDVPADTYYAGAVSWAVENGITTGVGNGKFNPTGACTRAQIAAFLTRLYAEK